MIIFDKGVLCYQKPSVVEINTTEVSEYAERSSFAGFSEQRRFDWETHQEVSRGCLDVILESQISSDCL